MKKKQLFVCNTYMQLICAVQMRKHFFNENSVEILLSDHSKNMDIVSKRLEKLDYFEKVYYIANKKSLYQSGRFGYYKYLFSLCFNNSKKIKDMLDAVNLSVCYDEIYFFNYDIFLISLYEINCNNNVHATLNMFEEGALGYSFMKHPMISRSLRIANKIRELKTNHKIIIDNYYCFYPDLFPGNSIEIPALNKNDKDVISLFNTLFNYYPTAFEFKEKYIYFSSNADIDGFQIHEEKIVEALLKKIGKENLLIKMHPRDTRTIFSEMNLHVYKDSSVPWEIIALSHNFSDKVLISLSSSSIIDPALLMHDDFEAYYLYPCIKGINKPYDQILKVLDIAKKILFLQENQLCLKFHVVNNVDEIFSPDYHNIRV